MRRDSETAAKKHCGCLKTYSKQRQNDRLCLRPFALLSLAWYPTFEVNQPLQAFFESTNVLLSLFFSFRKKTLAAETDAFVIVTPGSVMYNWKEELETWGHFKTGLYHGNTKEDTLQRALRGRLDVVLTTYETMTNHLVSCTTKDNKNKTGKYVSIPKERLAERCENRLPRVMSPRVCQFRVLAFRPRYYPRGK